MHDIAASVTAKDYFGGFKLILMSLPRSLSQQEKPIKTEFLL